MGFLRWFGITIDRGEVVVASVEFRLLGPQHLQRQHRFPGLGPSVLEVAPHDRGLLPILSRANAEEKAAVTVEIQHDDRFSEQQRIAFGHECDPGGQLDRARDGSGHG
jgi:hypothetical protein